MQHAADISGVARSQVAAAPQFAQSPQLLSAVRLRRNLLFCCFTLKDKVKRLIVYIANVYFVRDATQKSFVS